MKHKKIKILVNPNSGSFDKDKLQEVLTYLNKFMPTEAIYTNSYESAKETAKKLEALEDTLIVVSGGDGSLNTFLNNVSLKKYFGLLPKGTANVVAKELGISRNMSRAAKTLLTGAVTELDVGLCNNQRFLFTAGIGYDAEVAHNVSPFLKKLFGEFAYHLSALITFFVYKPPTFKVFMPDKNECLSAEYLIVSNMRRYGGDLFFAPNANYNDGLLDVLLVKKLNLKTLFKLLCFAKQKCKFPNKYLHRFRARQFTVTTEALQRFQLDGEVCAPANKFEFALDDNKAKIIVS